MTLREFANTTPLNKVIKVGTDCGGGWLFIGTVKDFLSLDMNSIDSMIRKKVVDVIPYYHKKKAQYPTNKAMQDKYDTREKTAIAYLDNYTPLLSRQVLSYYKGIQEPSINIIIEGRESGVYFMLSEVTDEKFKLNKNSLNMSSRKGENDDC